MVMGTLRQDTEVVIIGGGPGGYVAAIRAADLGKEVIVIEERETLGGVCLNEGCIPSKALINAVSVIDSAQQGEQFGLSFTNVSVDTDKLKTFTQNVVSGLTQGISGLFKKRGIEVIKGRAFFVDEHTLQVEGGSTIGFEQCIIATGSRSRQLPFTSDTKVWTSQQALELPKIPDHLVIIGGGYIGLELGLVYAGLGSKVSVVEFMPRLLAGADKDLVDVVVKHCTEKFETISLDSKVTDIKQHEEQFRITIEKDGQQEQLTADQVFVSIGRIPNTDSIGLDKLKVTMTDEGHIVVNEQNQTSLPHIYAIGDVTPGPMLAHKATRQAKVAAETIAGHLSAFDNRAIPAVVFTDPEIAWAGITEQEAQEKQLDYTVGKFPLRALGRARTLGRTDGLVKVIADANNQLVLGVGMVGAEASEMIAEATLAIEMGATLEDLMVTIHPHPTLSESIMEAAEVAAGMPVHINPAKVA